IDRQDEHHISTTCVVLGATRDCGENHLPSNAKDQSQGNLVGVHGIMESMHGSEKICRAEYRLKCFRGNAFCSLHRYARYASYADHSSPRDRPASRAACASLTFSIFT